MIDDLEDDDGRIIVAGGRTGPWHIFNSQEGGGNQQPPSSSPFLPEMSGANGTQRAVHTSGDGYTYAGVGFDLNNPDSAPESAKSQPFDASTWDGIAFWAKGTGKVRLEVPTRSFVPSDRGGNCSSDCWNVYGHRLPSPLSAEWQEHRVAFSVLEREMGGMSPGFNPTEAMSISFKHEGNDRFDFWIDEIRFYKAAPGPGGNP
jgi:hypothetical protein